MPAGGGRVYPYQHARGGRALTPAQLRAIGNLAYNYGRPAVRFAWNTLKGAMPSRSSGTRSYKRADRKRTPRMRRGLKRERGAADSALARGYRGYTSNYAGTMAIAGSADLNKIKKARGQGKPRGVIVVNRPKKRVLAKQKRRFDQSTTGTYYIGSNVNMDTQGNIGHFDRRYTKPSVDEKHSTGWIFNVGAIPLHWNPENLGVIGNQILDPNPPPLTYGPNPFYLINSTNTDLEQEDVMMKQTKLPETATPFNTSDIAIQSFYTVPNTILGLIDLNLSFTSSSISDQLLTVQVLRATSPEPTVPGYFSTQGPNGGISNSNMIKHLCNHRKNASGRLLEILYTVTFLLKGVNLNAKSPKVHYVKKKVKCNFLRSTCRRVSSATAGDTLGKQNKPSFEVDESGAMFNNCFVRAMATCTDNNVFINKTVSGQPGGQVPANMGASEYWYTVPQGVDMETLKNKGQTTMVNARFRYGGSISITHYCQETSRGFGSATTMKFGDVQSQMDAMQAQIDELTAYGEEHVEELDDHVADEDAHGSDDPPEQGPSNVDGHEHDSEVFDDPHSHANPHTAQEPHSHFN